MPRVRKSRLLFYVYIDFQDFLRFPKVLTDLRIDSRLRFANPVFKHNMHSDPQKILWICNHTLRCYFFLFLFFFTYWEDFWLKVCIDIRMWPSRYTFSYGNGTMKPCRLHMLIFYLPPVGKKVRLHVTFLVLLIERWMELKTPSSPQVTRLAECFGVAILKAHFCRDRQLQNSNSVVWYITAASIVNISVT